MKCTLFNLILIAVMMSCQPQENQNREYATPEALKLKVAEAADQLTQALLQKDQEALARICTEGLSYGHSSGAIQDKKTFIDDVVNGPFSFLTIDAESQTIEIYENLATVRNIFLGKGVNATDTINLRIGTVQLYKIYDDGSCRLVLRQGFKL